VIFLDIFLGIIGILIGYLLGSFNPSYFIARLKGIDIREEGTGNAGTSNLTLVLGFHYGLIAAVYDTLKGIISIFIALAIGANVVFAHLSGAIAIVGHIIPFYMKFHGGQGIATASGLMLFYMFTQYWFGFEFFYIIIFLGCIYGIFYMASRVKKSMPMVFPLPVYGYTIYLLYPDNPYNIYSWIILTFLFGFGIYIIFSLKLFKIKDENFKASWWRVVIRPVALLFLIFYFVYSKTVALLILWNDVERMVRRQKFQGYHHNIVAYSLAWLFQLTRSRIDLEKIWQKQTVGEPVMNTLEQITSIVNAHIRDTDQNVTEYCKKETCWDKLKNIEFTLPENIKEEYFTGEGHDTPDPAIPSDNEAIEFCKAKGSQAWYDLAKWLKEMNFLTPKARSQSFNMGRFLQRNKEPSGVLSKACSKIWNDAEIRGWKIDQEQE